MWGKKNTEEDIQCSLVKAPTVYLEPIPRNKIQLLMTEYKNQEWLAYLTGRISEDDNIFVEDIVVPPHKEVGVASAEAEPFHTPENCVGFIHSHHSMGAFHSITDQDYVDKNYPVSITIARNGQNELVFDTVSYQKTPCGKGITLKSVVKYVQPQPLYDKESFIKQAKGNIDKGKKTIPVTYRYAHRGVPFYPYGDEETYTIDDKGSVLSKQELQGILKDIYKDWRI